MTNITTFHLYISLLNSKDTKFVLNKLNEMSNQLRLTEVDTQIIKDIREHCLSGEVPSVAYLQNKYSFADTTTDDLLPVHIVPDAIDSTIRDLAIRQAKQDLKKEFLELGSIADSLDQLELRSKVSSLLENKLLAGQTENPTNAFINHENAYHAIHDADLKNGLDWFYPRVEQYAGKLSYGLVGFILAFAGSFKTVAAAQMALINALQGKNILYIALESSANDIKNRMTLNYIATTATSNSNLIDGLSIRDGKLTDDQIKYYNDKYSELFSKAGNHLIIWDESNLQYDTFLDMTESLRKADKMFVDATGRGLDGVVLDQLALLKFTTGGGKKYGYDGAILNDWVSYFRKQSLNFLETGRKIACVIVSQINRDSYTEASKPKKKGRYDITCASDANEIERAADTMVTLYKDLDTKDTVLINIPKARRGYVPDNPLQTNAYGGYYLIGEMHIEGTTISAADLETGTLSLEDLL